MNSKEKSLWCAQLALDKKAVDLVVLYVTSQSSFTDYFIICSGTSDRQVQAIASHIEMSCKHQGIPALGIEGLREGRWVLLDCDDVVIHIFHEPVRAFYDLERLWIESPRLEVETLQRAKGKTSRKHRT